MEMEEFGSDGAGGGGSEDEDAWLFADEEHDLSSTDEFSGGSSSGSTNTPLPSSHREPQDLWVDSSGEPLGLFDGEARGGAEREPLPLPPPQLRAVPTEVPAAPSAHGQDSAASTAQQLDPGLTEAKPLKRRRALTVDPPARTAPASVAGLRSHSSGSLPIKDAEHLLLDDSELGAGPRPALLSAIGPAVLGSVFKDDVLRRKSGSDSWVCKAGKKGSSARPTADGVWTVRRSYGTVTLSKSRAGMDAGASGGTLPLSLRFHRYTLEKNATGGGATQSRAGAGNVRSSMKLFHVLADQEQGEEASHTAGGVSAADFAYGGDLAAQRPEGLDAPALKQEAPTQEHSVTGLLVMHQPKQIADRAHGAWVSFRSGPMNVERERGAIVDSTRGAKLISGSGDFAEWHQRRQDERDFHEGDLVGLDRDGLLTRQTTSDHGVWQLGIITRRAVVEGSLPPDETKRSQFDTVAYSGRVVVRLLGSCNAGDFIVPSGLEDGTAYASPATSGRPSHTVGRALVGHSCVPNSITEATANTRREVALVEVTVIAPPDTVQQAETTASAKVKAACTVALIVLAFGVAFRLVASIWAESKDEPLAVSPLYPECPATNVSVLENGLCINCVGQDVVLHFERLRRRTGSAMEMQCPPTHHGSITRSCFDEVGSTKSVIMPAAAQIQGSALVPLTDGSALSGNCTRKACPELELTLQGWRETSWWSSHHVTVPRAIEGSGLVHIPCPTGSDGPYTGVITLLCGPRSEHWSQQQAADTNGTGSPQIVKKINTSACAWITCPRSCMTFNSSTNPREATVMLSPETADANSHWCAGTEQVELPRWSVGERHRALCCRNLAALGGCASSADGLGSATVQCSPGEDTGKEHWTVVQGGCLPPSALRLALGVNQLDAAAGVASALDTATQQQLFAAFSTGLGAIASNSTAGRWAVPHDGQLGRLSASWNEGPWAAIVSEGSSYTNSKTATTIRSGLHASTASRILVNGRSVAALANVSCRQLGLGSAYFVTNCRGLRQITASTPQAANRGWTNAMMELLCPGATTSGSHKCDRLLEVDIREENRNREADHLFDPEDPTSMCMGNESHVGQCFRSQLAQSSFPPEPGAASSQRLCDQALVVACSAERLASKLHGVWVVGDDHAHPDSTAAPAVVVDTGLRKGCKPTNAGDPACWAATLPLAQGNAYKDVTGP